MGQSQHKGPRTVFLSFSISSSTSPHFLSPLRLGTATPEFSAKFLVPTPRSHSKLVWLKLFTAPLFKLLKPGPGEGGQERFASSKEGPGGLGAGHPPRILIPHIYSLPTPLACTGQHINLPKLG